MAGAASRQLFRRRHHHYTCFLSADGEIDTAPLLQSLLKRGRQIWLPCLGQPTLAFKHYRPGVHMRSGAFGIREPATGPRSIRTQNAMDVVLMPLVGYDRHGNRLGMGGGYYDRTFAFRRWRRIWRKPLLIGVAFSAQEIDCVPTDYWDVPLDGVLTEQGVRWFEHPRPGGETQ